MPKRRKKPTYQLKKENTALAKGQAKARATGKWDPTQCTKELWEYYMAKIPPGAIAADMTKHAPHNSYGPLWWYEDVEFTCSDCGAHQVWTAQQQQWWYEEAKGSIYTRAKRCRTCRQARRPKEPRTQ